MDARSNTSDRALPSTYPHRLLFTLPPRAVVPSLISIMAVAPGDEHIKPLRESEKNLVQVARHIDTLKPNAGSVKEAQQYAIDALASVAYQVFAASQALVRTYTSEEGVKVEKMETSQERAYSCVTSFLFCGERDGKDVRIGRERRVRERERPHRKAWNVAERDCV